MGYRKIYPYILASESGESLRAAGWVCDGPAGGGSWSRDQRPRKDKHPTEPKIRWHKILGGRPRSKPRSPIQQLMRDLVG